jgi:hypothetical protein
METTLKSQPKTTPQNDELEPLAICQACDHVTIKQAFVGFEPDKGNQYRPILICPVCNNRNPERFSFVAREGYWYADAGWTHRGF